MSMLDTLERGALFSITRFVALAGTLLLFLGLIAVLVYGATQLPDKQSSKVTPADVMKALKPDVAAEKGAEPSAEPQAAISPLAGYKLPFVMQKHFANQQNANFLAEKLKGLTKEKADEYIEELAAVIAEMEKTKGNVIDAVNAFVPLKAAKLQDEFVQNAMKKEMRLYVAGAVVTTLILVALLSLILVLLAIERNTRKPSEG